MAEEDYQQIYDDLAADANAEEMSMEEITSALAGMKEDEVMGFAHGVTAHRQGDSWEVYIPGSTPTADQQFRALMAKRKRSGFTTSE